jgi:uncharacterized protein YdhG (YjbR/CyaY superfamily)
MTAGVFLFILNYRMERLYLFHNGFMETKPLQNRRMLGNLDRINEMKETRGPAMTVDEFVQTKVLPEYRDVVALIRQYMRELAPDAQELISYGIPAYKLTRIIAVISPTKKDITLSFSRGMQMEDRYNLLKGVGKSSKHIKFKSVDDVNKEVLAYYVNQALELNTK